MLLLNLPRQGTALSHAGAVHTSRDRRWSAAETRPILPAHTGVPVKPGRSRDVGRRPPWTRWVHHRSIRGRCVHTALTHTSDARRDEACGQSDRKDDAKREEKDGWKVPGLWKNNYLVAEVWQRPVNSGSSVVGSVPRIVLHLHPRPGPRSATNGEESVAML